MKSYGTLMLLTAMEFRNLTLGAGVHYRNWVLAMLTLWRRFALETSRHYRRLPFKSHWCYRKKPGTKELAWNQRTCFRSLVTQKQHRHGSNQILKKPGDSRRWWRGAQQSKKRSHFPLAASLWCLPLTKIIIILVDKENKYW